MPRPKSLIRPLVRALHPYTPGEQPRIRGLIKLNTNENPYPPSPKVLDAVRAAVDGRLRLYPDPSADRLREGLARLHGCETRQIIVGNGSDELLALAVRSFVEPAGDPGAADSASTVQFFSPSYSLYPVLAASHGASVRSVPLGEGFSLPSVGALRKSGQFDFRAALTFVTTPNAPSGAGYTREALRRLVEATKGVVVLDEAYVDFAEEDALQLALDYPHVLVSRTFSKAYSLCFQRVGYFIGHPELISALQAMRDSYNVNGLGQIAAEATLRDLAYYRRGFSRIKRTREHLRKELGTLGWEVLPSQTNFLMGLPPGAPAREWLGQLRDRKILVRWFSAPDLSKWLRITIGSEEEAEALLRAVRDIQIRGKR
jgi:histidinol-phosphate aminotransferase